MVFVETYLEINSDNPQLISPENRSRESKWRSSCASKIL